MNDHKKIDWLRWHKRKMWIRINCAILTAILLITLLLQYPIISDAATRSAANLLNDYYFANEFYTLTGANSAYPDYDLSNLYHHATDSSYDYYDDIKYLFEEVPLDMGMTSSNNFAIFTSKEDSNELIVLFCSYLTFSYNRSTQAHPIIVHGTNNYFIYDITNRTVSSRTSFGASTSYVDDTLLGYFLLGNMNIVLYNDSSQKVADNVNYLIDQNLVGYGSGGFGVTSPHNPNDDILNGDYIYNNSNIFVSGSSADDYKLTVVFDFPEGTTYNNYTYKLNFGGDVSVDFIRDNDDNINFSSYYGVQTYGSISNIYDHNDFSFSGSTENGLTNNILVFNSSMLNSLMQDGYNANIPFIGGTQDYNVNSAEFFRRLSALKVYNYYNIPNILSHSLMDSLGIKSSMPGYVTDNAFNPTLADFTFSIDLYKNGNSIFSVPLSCTYNAITGQSTVTSNPGYDKDTVDNVINEHNENLNPTDPDYKDPNNYLPTNPSVPNVPTDQTNNYNPSNNNNTTVTSGDYSPSVVNNNSVTVNENRNLDTGILNKFVRIINNDKNNTVNDLTTLTGANNYIALMQNALTVIPVQVWQIYIVALKAMFGIIISALFLKILINWAT